LTPKEVRRAALRDLLAQPLVLLLVAFIPLFIVYAVVVGISRGLLSTIVPNLVVLVILEAAVLIAMPRLVAWWYGRRWGGFNMSVWFSDTGIEARMSRRTSIFAWSDFSHAPLIGNRRARHGGTCQCDGMSPEKMSTVGDFIRCVRREFLFLEALGFREAGDREDRDDLYGEVVFESAETELTVWIDGRGEVDADVRRVAFAEPKAEISRFDRSQDPNLGVRPAFAFGRAEGTSLDRAVALLAAFVKNETLDALRGEAGAWERAATWTQPQARLP
jgi:hypothetical protein